ncbi:hypothetical protein WJX72_006788 [[Myrmecia] bisecta]|uniref:Uncharacterized protein n=1 Tax=[Myrmecia] bisecta TaxID=41462 RepID=A0AAW1QR66_9CHLO
MYQLHEPGAPVKKSTGLIILGRNLGDGAVQFYAQYGDTTKAEALKPSLSSPHERRASALFKISKDEQWIATPLPSKSNTAPFTLLACARSCELACPGVPLYLTLILQAAA